MKIRSKKLVLILAMGTVATLTQNVAWADRLDDIKAKGTLVCGTLGTAPPFSYQDPQTRKTIGYDVEVCEVIAKHLGVKNEVKLIAVPARIPEVAQGRVDVVAAALGWTPERSKQALFSYSYYSTSTALAVGENKGMDSWSNMAGKKVGSINATTSAAGVRANLPQANLVTFEDPSQVYLAMRQKKIDAIALNENNLRYYQKTVKDTPDAVKLIMEPPIFTEKYGVGIKLGEERLLAAVNEALIQADKAGELQAIFDKYLGENTEYKLTRKFRVEAITE